MKHLTAVCFLASFLLSFLFLNAQRPSTASKVDVTKTNGISIGSMQGVYNMLRQVVNNGTKDSVLGNEQLKIYTDRYMMYAHRIAGDSLAEYGVGTYSIQNGKLMEYVFYTSSGGTRKDTVELLINKSGDGYTQVINYPQDSMGVKYVLTEDYATVSKEVSSPLDGAWKQTKTSFMPTNGTAVTDDNPTQFKVFQSGHFIWANTSKDSATQKPVSFFGYGTFEMKGNQVVEHNTHSSFTQGVVGTPITLQIAFTGKDSYTQTINWPTGRSVEVYQRMK